MKPLSAWYYIKENKMKSFIVIMLMFLSVCVFSIGNYIHSDEYSFKKSYKYSEKLINISYMSIDEDGKDFESYTKSMSDVLNVKFIPKGYYAGNLSRTSTMGLELTTPPFVFQNADDMKTVFEYLGIEIDFSNIKNKSMVISKNLADNLNLKLGDTVGKDTKNSTLKTDFTIDGIIDDGAYQVFYICEREAPFEFYMYDDVDTISTKDFYKLAIACKMDRKVYVEQPLEDLVKANFSFVNLIFYTVSFIVAIVITIVANTVITGFFIKRKYEFGIFRALGISRKKIKIKIAKELILMDAIGCAIGFAVTFVATYLLNSFIFIPDGKYMVYWSFMGIVGFAVCNMLILIPMIIAKGNQMARADVTEY